MLLHVCLFFPATYAPLDPVEEARDCSLSETAWTWSAGNHIGGTNSK